jgi:hypothetical protein
MHTYIHTHTEDDGASAPDERDQGTVEDMWEKLAVAPQAHSSEEPDVPSSQCPPSVEEII